MQDTSVITLTLDPISEADFPQSTPRMQELINKFQSENHTPARQSTQSHVVIPKASKNTKCFEDLSSSEQKYVLDRISSVDYTKSSDILNFASSNNSDFTALTDEILKIQTRNPIDSLSEPIFDVLSVIRSQSLEDILGTMKVDTTQTELGVFSSIREMLYMQKVHKRMAQTIYSLNTLMKNIKGMQVDLKKQQFGLQKDISLYEKMLEKATEHFNDLELDCIALEKMQSDVESKLAVLTSKKEASMSETNDIDQLSSAISCISGRFHTVSTMRVVTFQSIMQLSMLISTDKLLCAKIDEINDTVIPLWKWQYISAVEIIKQQNAISLHKALRGIASKVFTGNDQHLRDTMISAQKEVSTTATAVDDLGMVQSYIDDSLTKVAEVVCPALGKRIK